MAFESNIPVSRTSTRSSSNSIYTSYTTVSSSTIPGPGALGGKAILALGKFTLRQIGNIIIRWKGEGGGDSGSVNARPASAHGNPLEPLGVDVTSLSLSRTSSRTSSKTSSELSSYTTTSSRTIPGPGALGGKAILALGKFTLRQFETIMIHHQMRSFLTIFPHQDDGVGAIDNARLTKVYSEVLELTRPGMYPDNIRKPALKLLQTQITNRQTRSLVRCLETWEYIETIMFLAGMMNYAFPTLSEPEWIENWTFDKTFSCFISGVPGNGALLEFTTEVAAMFPPELPETVSRGTFYLDLPFNTISPDKQIEQSLRDAKIKMSERVNVLILGSDDSSKPSILREMRQKYPVGVRPAREIEAYRQLVLKDILQGISKLIDAMENVDLGALENNLADVTLIRDYTFVPIPAGVGFPLELHKPLCSIWSDPATQRFWNRADKTSFPANVAYFLSALDRIFEPTYLPTEIDISNCSSHPSGVTETVFNLRLPGWQVNMIDVGDLWQRSERRKWMHQFQGVSMIILIADLTGYDRWMGDIEGLQMQTDMARYDYVCNLQWFKSTPILLILDNLKLFEEKIKMRDIHDFFPDYTGQPGDARAGCDYFKRRFSKLAKGSAKIREVYIHTRAGPSDASMPRVIMAAIEESVVFPTRQ